MVCRIARAAAPPMAADLRRVLSDQLVGGILLPHGGRAIQFIGPGNLILCHLPPLDLRLGGALQRGALRNQPAVAHGLLVQQHLDRRFHRRRLLAGRRLLVSRCLLAMQLGGCELRVQRGRPGIHWLEGRQLVAGLPGSEGLGGLPRPSHDAFFGIRSRQPERRRVAWRPVASKTTAGRSQQRRARRDAREARGEQGGKTRHCWQASIAESVREIVHVAVGGGWTGRVVHVPRKLRKDSRGAWRRVVRIRARRVRPHRETTTFKASADSRKSAGWGGREYRPFPSTQVVDRTAHHWAVPLPVRPTQLLRQVQTITHYYFNSRCTENRKLPIQIF